MQQTPTSAPTFIDVLIDLNQVIQSYLQARSTDGIIIKWIGIILAIVFYCYSVWLSFKLGRKTVMKKKDYTKNIKKQKLKAKKFSKRKNFLTKLARRINLLIWFLILILIGVIGFEVYGSLSSGEKLDMRMATVIFYRTDLMIYTYLAGIFIFLGLRWFLFKLCKILEKRQISAEKQRDRFVENVLEELGTDISKALYDYVAGEMIQQNKNLEKKVEGQEKSVLKMKFKQDASINSIEAYEKFLEGLLDFTWCADCLAESMISKKTDLDQDLEKDASTLSLGSIEQKERKSPAKKSNWFLSANNLLSSSKSDKNKLLGSTKSSQGFYVKKACSKNCLKFFFTEFKEGRRKLSESLKEQDYVLDRNMKKLKFNEYSKNIEEEDIEKEKVAN